MKCSPALSAVFLSFALSVGFPAFATQINVNSQFAIKSNKGVVGIYQTTEGVSSTVSEFLTFVDYLGVRSNGIEIIPGGTTNVAVLVLDPPVNINGNQVGAVSVAVHDADDNPVDLNMESTLQTIAQSGESPTATTDDQVVPEPSAPADDSVSATPAPTSTSTTVALPPISLVNLVVSPSVIGEVSSVLRELEPDGEPVPIPGSLSADGGVQQAGEHNFDMTRDGENLNVSVTSVEQTPVASAAEESSIITRSMESIEEVPEVEIDQPDDSAESNAFSNNASLQATVTTMTPDEVATLRENKRVQHMGNKEWLAYQIRKFCDGKYIRSFFNGGWQMITGSEDTKESKKEASAPLVQQFWSIIFAGVLIKKVGSNLPSSLPLY